MARQKKAQDGSRRPLVSTAIGRATKRTESIADSSTRSRTTAAPSSSGSLKQRRRRRGLQAEVRATPKKVATATAKKVALTESRLVRLRKICLALPNTKETMTWGKPHFRIGEKIFAGFGDVNDHPVVGCKLNMANAAAIVQLPGFSRAPYVGNKGWISIDLAIVKDWKLIRELIEESYALIAPCPKPRGSRK